MLRLILRGLGARRLRSALTALSILIGVAMVSGTFVLTDQIRHAFDDIFVEANEGIDVIVSTKPAFESQQSPDAGPLPESLVARVGAVDGVARVEGQVLATGALVVDGKYLGSKGGAPSLVVSSSPDPVGTTKVVDGSIPDAPGEIAVDDDMADSKDLSVGQKAQLATKVGLRPVTISGIFHIDAAIGGATIVVTTLEDAQRWYDREGEVSVINAAAADGTSPATLARRVQAVVPDGVRVQTGLENAQEQSDQVGDAIGTFITPVLLGLAAVAVLVGAFIIFNVFSITVAQRTRELAMLRTIGASRRQLLQGVLGEALVIAIVASILGLLGGFLFAALVVGLFDAFGFGLPTAGAELQGRTIATALIVGITVPLIAALIPALRATRIAPVAALREGAVLPRGRLSRLSPVIAAILGVLGVLILVAGLASDSGVGQRLLTLMAGAVLLLAAAAMVLRYAVRPIVRVVAKPLQALYGGTATLARDNTARNPARTASTASALTIGVALVVLVTVLAQGFKESFTGALDKLVQADLIVTSRDFSFIPRAAVDAMRAVPGMGGVAPVAFAEVRVDGASDALNGIDPRSGAELFEFDWKDGGSDALFGRLGRDDAVIEDGFATEHHLEVGDGFTAIAVGGERATLRVIGIYKDPQLFTGATVANLAFDPLVPDDDPFVIVARYAPGADRDTVRAGVEKALEQFPAAEVRSKSEYTDSVEGQVNQLLTFLYVLLAFSVLISLVGIVVTLVLTIYERTREIGMLRAIGTTRPQLRRIVRLESAITATIGSLLGMVVGLVLGWLMIEGLGSEGIVFVVPWVQLVVILLAAFGLGVLAGVFPARRAAKLDVLRALSYE
ncbi:MAG: putative transport system permease protein [Miltoncostaeaceae bacterium]|nr:putative transport system permease protein [Miltoncostaeaceae bacterium]